jgi:hypothetical protein
MPKLLLDSQTDLDQEGIRAQGILITQILSWLDHIAQQADHVVITQCNALIKGSFLAFVLCGTFE